MTELEMIRQKMMQTHLFAGHQGFVVVEPEPSSSSFEWYGAQYSQHDLAEALAVVSGSEDRCEHLLSLSSGRYRLPASVARPVWQQVFNANAVLLLDTLATFPQEVGPVCHVHLAL